MDKNEMKEKFDKPYNDLDFGNKLLADWMLNILRKAQEDRVKLNSRKQHRREEVLPLTHKTD